MTTRLDPTWQSEGLAVTLQVDGSETLTDLTRAVSAICDQIENRHEKSVAIIEISDARAEEREWPGDVSIQAVNRWERAVRRLENLSAVSIASVGGTCGGPSLDLFLAADYRIGTPDLRLVLPINDGHFWPGMSLFRLVHQVGQARARQIVLWGTDISLAAASDLGLIDRVSNDLGEAVRIAAVLVARISDRETAVRRQLLAEAGSTEFDDALGVHLAACDRELRRLRTDPLDSGTGAMS